EIGLTRDAVPFGERRRIFINRRRWNPTTFADIVRPADRNRGITSVNVAAFYRIAEDQRVTSPGVIGTAAIRLKRAAKVRCGEERDAIGNTELLGRLIKRVHALAELGEQDRKSTRLNSSH